MNQTFESMSTKASINQNNNYFQNICSLKTPKYNLPKDILVIKIYKNILRETDKIFPSMPKKINLSYSENKIRTELILEIKNFINKYRLNEWCFFYCVFLIDKLLTLKTKLKIHEICIGSLLLSTKFLEIDGHLPHLNKFQEILNPNQKMSLRQLIEIELFCLKTLDYKLCIPETFYYINIILINGIIFNTDSKKRKLSGSIYNLPYQIYEEVIIKNNDYLQFHPLLLAFSCVAFSRKLYKLDNWDIVFTKVFNINFNDIDDVYQFILNMYQRKNNNDNIENLNINKEINYIREKSKNSIENNNKEIIKKELKYSSSTFDVNARRKLINQENRDYILKTREKYDSIKNISDVTLKSYINKNRGMNINLDIKHFETIMKNKKEKPKLNDSPFFNSNSKRNSLLTKKCFSNQNSNNDLIKNFKINQSFNNYNQQLKIDLTHSIKIKECNESKTIKKTENENEKNNFYNSIHKSTSNKFQIGNNLISAIRRAKLTFLKDSKSTNNYLNSLNMTLNDNNNNNNNNKNKNINMNTHIISHSNNQIGSYQIKGLQRNKKPNLQTESNKSLISNNKFKFLFFKK